MTSKKNIVETVCKESVFARLYQDYAQLLRNYIFYKFGNLENAEDVTQNAFIKLWENCHKVSMDKVKGYLFTIANNLSLNTIKHDKVVLNYKAGYTQSVNNETPEFFVLEKEFKEKLNRAIGNLSEKQRTVFLMNRIDKLKYVEIAELLGISVKAVEKRMHMALQYMRKEVGKI